MLYANKPTILQNAGEDKAVENLLICMSNWTSLVYHTLDGKVKVMHTSLIGVEVLIS